MTQKRPVPNRVVLGSLTDRRIWRVTSRSPGPDRLVEDDGVVAHDRLGQAEPLLEVEVDLEGKSLGGPPGRPVVGAEPHRHHGRGSDGPPVTSSATASSQNSGLAFSTEEQVVHT